MRDLNYLWNILSNQLKTELASEIYSTWIEPNSIQFIDLKNKNITILSDNSLIADYLETILDTRLKDILKTFTGLDFTISYTYSSSPEESSSLPKFSSHSLCLETDNTPLFPGKYVSNLNKKFSFDNFIVGDNSSAAYNFAYHTTVSPGEYNPVSIFGDVGLGKTHLLHAIGNQMEADFPHLKILYVPTEVFLNDYLQSLSGLLNLKQKYTSVDVLLVDNLEFFANKKDLQNEFLEILNILVMERKQVVIMSEREPNEEWLEERLNFKLNSGMGLIFDLTQPDYDTLVAIIKLKAEGLQLDEASVSYIAENISGNVRSIESIIKAIKSTTNLDSSATLDMIKEIIKQN